MTTLPGADGEALPVPPAGPEQFATGLTPFDPDYEAAREAAAKAYTQALVDLKARPCLPTAAAAVHAWNKFAKLAELAPV